MTKFSSFDDAMPCWVDVMVETDDEHQATRAFLSTLFDWTWELGGPEMGGYSLALSGGLPVLGLGKTDGVHGAATTYFSTSDIDDAIVRATDGGATTLMPRMDVMDLGSMAVLVDPVGAVFGLWQPGSFHGFGVMHEENAAGWFDHSSADADRAAEFYLKLSGHQLTSPGENMRVLANGDAWYASFTQVDGAPAQWNPIYVVDSLERAREVVTRHGGAILVEEMPVPGSAICVFTEPVNGTTMTVMRGGEHPDE
ncbi:MAG: VOC family protein [Acidimicrobiales bacterium]